jgi:hypothetical protein
VHGFPTQVDQERLTGILKWTARRGIRPARMTGRQLQDGTDWLYRQFYRLDRIILRTAHAALTVGLVPAYLIWRLNMTYRYDNRREGIVGHNPALESRASLGARLLGPVRAAGPSREPVLTPGGKPLD